MYRPRTLLQLVLAIPLFSVSLEAQTPWRWPGTVETLQCRLPTTKVGADSWLDWAAKVVGLERVGQQILHYSATDIAVYTYQSDRVYQPFLEDPAAADWWFDAATGNERTYGGRGRPTVVRSEHATYMARDTAMAPVPQLHAALSSSRWLNPLAAIFDWRHGAKPTVEKECLVRDYWRVVLHRPGLGDGERFFFDLKTGFPVQITATEPHYLWGQVPVEYLYTTWWATGPAFLPVTSFRLTDGVVELKRSIALGIGGDLVSTDSSVKTRLPLNAPDMGRVVPAFLQPDNPDTIRVAPNLFLLKNRGYTHAVTLARDTVFLFEATQGEVRARADSAWIGKLFPGRHPIVVVVTDLAWPHIAGARYWASLGIPIVTHKLSRPFLDQVFSRKFTLEPDRLERRRSAYAPRFRLASDSLALAGGDVKVYAIDGIGSEGALLGYVGGANFVWGSDFVQTAAEPSFYALEMIRAIDRYGLKPARIAAQHLPLVDWSTLTKLNPEP